ncbi:MAG: transporter substrate-binding domain-containing protein [Desulfamplus sp.]|nr:transporter substrate-binding domain-containing protein [Desulfamplus sp.]
MKKIFISIVFVLLSLSICNAEEKVIQAAADNYPPFVDASDVKEGLAMVLIRAAYATQGYTVKLVFVPWARAENMTVEGKYDILPDVWVNDNRKKVMMFSEPYASNAVKIITNANDPFVFDGVESLKGKKIGTVRNYGYSINGVDIREIKDFTCEDAVDIATNIKKLVGKRFDLTLEDEIVARVTIANQIPDLLTKVKFSEKALFSNNLHVTAGLKNPRHKEFIDAFNKGLAEIKANGEFKKIFESYGVKIE